MKLKELEKKAKAELEEDKKYVAKEVLKDRLSEIAKVKKVLARLEAKYKEMLDKDVDEVVEEVENDRIRF